MPLVWFGSFCINAEISFSFQGPNSKLVAFADDAMEGEADGEDDEEATVADEGEEGTAEEGDQAVVDKVCTYYRTSCSKPVIFFDHVGTSKQTRINCYNF